MAKSMMGLWSQFLLTILLIVAANRAGAAGTVFTVTFSGTASGSSTGTFSGTFAYDQSLLANPDHTFQFQVIQHPHMMEYTTPTGTGTGLDSRCEPFKITTFGNTFILRATVVPQSPAPQSPATTVTIVVPTTVAMEQRSLPDCSVFPSSPTNSTFTLSGGITFTGTITAIRCITADIIAASASRLHLPRPPPSPPPCPPPSPPPCYVYTYPAPAPCPAYACPPRPACCLTRLFARRSHRNSCW